MSKPLPSTVKLLALASVVSFATACAAYPPIASAQGKSIPVLVMGEDEDPNTVKRSSDIFKRVFAELRGQMRRHGYRMIDEDSVAVDAGFTIEDRRSKSELIDFAKDLNKTGKASHRFRAWVLFRIHASAEQKKHAVEVRTRIVGEIYDALDNTQIGEYEMLRDEYPGPADCLEGGGRHNVCITEVVGDRARKIARGLGEALARELNRKVKEDTGQRRHSAMELGYTLTLRNFSNREALTIAGVMADEFPGFRSIDLIEKSPTDRIYDYRTTAKAFKLDEWLEILLRDMGFDSTQEVLIQIRGTDILVDNLYATPERPESKDESKRFK